LRRFELQLLGEIGYALDLEREAVNQAPLQPDQCYEFHAEGGVVPAINGESDDSVFSGATLLAIGRMELENEKQLRDAKRLLRSVLNYHLGDRGLKTRRVAAAMKRS
jgi:DNA repair protein RecO (recombination protein O)